MADAVGALTTTDIAHIGGLVAADVMRNPLDAGFDFVASTTHLGAAVLWFVVARQAEQRRAAGIEKAQFVCSMNPCAKHLLRLMEYRDATPFGYCSARVRARRAR